MKTEQSSTAGWCTTCEMEHRLDEGKARAHAVQLIRELETHRRIDHLASANRADPRFSTDYLFGSARGQMFGVLECMDRTGTVYILRAFSCQYNSTWCVDAWAPPLFDIKKYHAIMQPADRIIKELGRQIDLLPADSDQRTKLICRRKQRSQRIMKELHALYVLTNFRGETCSMTDLFPKSKGIPTGTGDCCAPKLLNYAATNQLRPVGLCEFYWGKENASGSRQHGQFYSNCMDKCYPLLGFMLCGAAP